MFQRMGEIAMVDIQVEPWVLKSVTYDDDGGNEEAVVQFTNAHATPENETSLSLHVRVPLLGRNQNRRYVEDVAWATLAFLLDNWLDEVRQHLPSDDDQLS